MAFLVVCLSHTDGSGGAGIGHEVARQLGYRYVDEEILVEAARLADVDPLVIAEAEQNQSLLDRILDRLSSAQESVTAALGSRQAPPAEHWMTAPDRDDMRHLIRAAIGEVARGGHAVIVAHAASLALAGRPGVLRVLMTAPEEIRRQRLEQQRKLSPQAAADAIRHGDARRRDYLQSLYDIREELPTHYDVVINGEVLSRSEIVSLLVATVRNGE